MSDPVDRSTQQVFFISRIGPEASRVRFDSDVVLHNIAKPAARLAGFEDAERADEVDKLGRITSRVVERIVNGPAVIADLTGRNPNVYYEVALAHASRVPLVQIVEQSEIDSIPFDVSDQNTIGYTAGDFATYQVAAKRVAAQLQSAIDDPARIDNPIEVFTQFKCAREASGDDNQEFAQILDILEDLRGRVPAASGSAVQAGGRSSPGHPPPIHQFFGSVDAGHTLLIDGRPIPDGTRIYAWADSGEAIGDAVVTDGTWLIQIDPRRAASTRFSVDDSSFISRYVVAAGNLTQVNLDLTRL